MYSSFNEFATSHEGEQREKQRTSKSANPRNPCWQLRRSHLENFGQVGLREREERIGSETLWSPVLPKAQVECHDLLVTLFCLKYSIVVPSATLQKRLSFVLASSLGLNSHCAVWPLLLLLCFVRAILSYRYLLTSSIHLADCLTLSVYIAREPVGRSDFSASFASLSCGPFA